MSVCVSDIERERETDTEREKEKDGGRVKEKKTRTTNTQSYNLYVRCLTKPKSVRELELNRRNTITNTYP